MSELSMAVDDYIALRRALGHKMELAARLLAQFAAYYERAEATHVTTEFAVAWATLPAGASAGWKAQRLGVVRGFAAWLQTQDARTQVPPADILPGRFERAVPYLYSEDDIAALMAATADLPLALQRHTYRTLIGLLSVTGMRIGEAIGLARDDVHAARGVLRVVNSKFGKSREIPLHPSVIEALRRYAEQRDRLCPTPSCDSFFVSTRGTRLRYSVVATTFRKLTQRAGLHPRSQRCRPRIHCLRHSFAVRALAEGYATGADVQALLPLLSTWLGHVDPASTYWYLSAAPELLAHASRRLEATFEQATEDDQ
jgi:site-specific recombinase XerD